MNKLLFTLILIALSTKAFAQPFGAYVSDREEFYAMDSLTILRLDHLPPLSYKVGKNCIAFIDNTKNFKIYAGGRTQQIAEGYTQDYHVTTNLVTIQSNGMLYVWDNGKMFQLAQVIDNYTSGDSIVAYYDRQKYEFNCYWNGRILKLEEGIGGNPAVFMTAGDNLVAYTNTFNNFRIVYRGEIIDQESQRPQSFRCGANTVAYVDNDNNFKIFHAGDTYDITPFMPRNYHVGDGLVAYVDNTNQFNIFDNGTLVEIGNYSPAYLRVMDNIVVYADGTGGLNMYYNGTSQRLENRVPQDLHVSSNSLAYVDESKRVQFYTYGRQVNIPNVQEQGLELYYDVLKIKTGFNSFRFYWKDYVVP